MIVVDFAVYVSTHWLDWNEFLAFMVRTLIIDLIDEMHWFVNIFPSTALYTMIVEPENLSHENN